MCGTSLRLRAQGVAHTHHTSFLHDSAQCVQMAKLGVALTEGRTGAGGSSGGSADVQMANGCTSSGGNALQPDQAAAPEAPDAEPCAVRPAAFKALVGRGHSEFQSNRQQVGVLPLMPRFLHAERPAPATSTQFLLPVTLTLVSGWHSSPECHHTKPYLSCVVLFPVGADVAPLFQRRCLHK